MKHTNYQEVSMKAIVFILVLLCGSVEAKQIRVALASKSAVKEQAVREAFPNDQVDIVTFESHSGILEQPIGEKMATQGIINRIEGIQKEKFNYVIAIENFIDQEDGWYDCGLVYVSGELGRTARTPIPNDIVRSAFTEGKTVGEVMHEQNRSIDRADWHSAYGSSSRKDLLRDAVFKAVHKEEIDRLQRAITYHPDFPKKGVLFEDFSPLLRDPELLKLCISLLKTRCHDRFDVVVGLESRGFILGSLLAYELNIPFVMVRKAGKIPGETYTVEYEKEYGKDAFSLSQTAINQGDRVLIIDDLIATGGSACAAVDLIEMSGGIPEEFISLLEIPEMEGRKRLNINTFNLLY